VGMVREGEQAVYVSDFSEVVFMDGMGFITLLKTQRQSSCPWDWQFFRQALHVIMTSGFAFNGHQQLLKRLVFADRNIDSISLSCVDIHMYPPSSFQQHPAHSASSFLHNNTTSTTKKASELTLSSKIQSTNSTAHTQLQPKNTINPPHQRSHLSLSTTKSPTSPHPPSTYNNNDSSRRSRLHSNPRPHHRSDHGRPPHRRAPDAALQQKRQQIPPPRPEEPPHPSAPGWTRRARSPFLQGWASA
jgi:hypothetical protein